MFNIAQCNGTKDRERLINIKLSSKKRNEEEKNQKIEGSISNSSQSTSVSSNFNSLPTELKLQILGYDVPSTGLKVNSELSKLIIDLVNSKFGGSSMKYLNHTIESHVNNFLNELNETELEEELTKLTFSSININGDSKNNSDEVLKSIKDSKVIKISILQILRRAIGGKGFTWDLLNQSKLDQLPSIISSKTNTTTTTKSTLPQTLHFTPMSDKVRECLLNNSLKITASIFTPHFKYFSLSYAATNMTTARIYLPFVKTTKDLSLSQGHGFNPSISAPFPISSTDWIDLTGRAVIAINDRSMSFDSGFSIYIQVSNPKLAILLGLPLSCVKKPISAFRTDLESGGDNVNTRSMRFNPFVTIAQLLKLSFDPKDYPFYEQSKSKDPMSGFGTLSKIFSRDGNKDLETVTNATKELSLEEQQAIAGLQFAMIATGVTEIVSNSGHTVSDPLLRYPLYGPAVDACQIVWPLKRAMHAFSHFFGHNIEDRPLQPNQIESRYGDEFEKVRREKSYLENKAILDKEAIQVLSAITASSSLSTSVTGMTDEINKTLIQATRKSILSSLSNYPPTSLPEIEIIETNNLKMEEIANLPRTMKTSSSSSSSSSTTTTTTTTTTTQTLIENFLTQMQVLMEPILETFSDLPYLEVIRSYCTELEVQRTGFECDIPTKPLSKESNADERDNKLKLFKELYEEILNNQNSWGAGWGKNEPMHFIAPCTETTGYPTFGAYIETFSPLFLSLIGVTSHQYNVSPSENSGEKASYAVINFKPNNDEVFRFRLTSTIPTSYHGSGTCSFYVSMNDKTYFAVQKVSQGSGSDDDQDIASNNDPATCFIQINPSLKAEFDSVLEKLIPIESWPPSTNEQMRYKQFIYFLLTISQTLRHDHVHGYHFWEDPNFHENFAGFWGERS